MIPLILSIMLNVDTGSSYIHAVPSINKDTVYIYNGYMCDIFIEMWQIADPEQKIEVVSDIIPYRKRYINHLETISNTAKYN